MGSESVLLFKVCKIKELEKKVDSNKCRGIKITEVKQV